MITKQRTPGGVVDTWGMPIPVGHGAWLLTGRSASSPAVSSSSSDAVALAKPQIQRRQDEQAEQRRGYQAAKDHDCHRELNLMSGQVAVDHQR